MTKTMLPGRSNRGMTSIWSHVIRDGEGRLKVSSPPHANLRVNSGNDWQGLMMAGTSSAANIFATASGTATSTTATTLVNTGAAFPTSAVVTGATGGLAGQIVCTGDTYGVILSNTATTLTIDRWVNAATPYTTVTTPSGTSKYQVIQGMAPAWYMALSTTVQSGTATDTILAGEITGSGLARTNATSITHTVAAATYSLVKTFTATGTVGPINSEAIFTATGAAGVGAAATSGIMVFENAEPSPPTLVNLDTLQQTVTVTY